MFFNTQTRSSQTERKIVSIPACVGILSFISNNISYGISGVEAASWLK